MKIILGIYALLCWLLLKFGIVKKSLGNLVAMGCGGAFLLFVILTFTRYLGRKLVDRLIPVAFCKGFSNL